MSIYKIKARRPDRFEQQPTQDKRKRDERMPHWQKWSRETVDRLKAEKQQKGDGADD